ncbi:hypothetical protein DBT_1979 [Dissulfuribacter thermophilus]|uniref:Uncharacterized protein n=1 Tax=Dissulfuribacter thermophilus TaxID=1156395 RepID=A0A1B9F4B3_9BACT|nr:hypothetical protein DBT_1979 [Dissulfuribacter thermophilus]
MFHSGTYPRFRPVPSLLFLGQFVIATAFPLNVFFESIEAQIQKILPASIGRVSPYLAACVMIMQNIL